MKTEGKREEKLLWSPHLFEMRPCFKDLAASPRFEMISNISVAINLLI